jgi:hypothetical protein
VNKERYKKPTNRHLTVIGGHTKRIKHRAYIVIGVSNDEIPAKL